MKQIKLQLSWKLTTLYLEFNDGSSILQTIYHDKENALFYTKKAGKSLYAKNWFTISMVKPEFQSRVLQAIKETEEYSVWEDLLGED